MSHAQLRFLSLLIEFDTSEAKEKIILNDLYSVEVLAIELHFASVQFHRLLPWATKMDKQ
jgi:hypothetical protein